ncbi:MAG: spore cortex biosynthesis protein YabQ [bacterium]
MLSLDFQFQAFCITIVAGATVGILFDVYRIIRGLTGPGRLFTCLGDLLFWAVAASIVFAFLIYGNWGEVRLYVFIGLAAGAGIYFRLFSRPLLRLLIGLTRLLRFIIRKTTCFFLVVILLPYRVVRRIAGWLFVVLAFPFRPLVPRFAPVRRRVSALLPAAKQRLWDFCGRIIKKE